MGGRTVSRKHQSLPELSCPNAEHHHRVCSFLCWNWDAQVWDFHTSKNHRECSPIPAFICELDLLHLPVTSHCHRDPNLRASVQPPCSLGSGWRRKAASHQQYQAGVKLWLRFPPGSPLGWGLAGDVGVSQLLVWQAVRAIPVPYWNRILWLKHKARGQDLCMLFVTATVSQCDLGQVRFHALFVWFPLVGLKMEFLIIKKYPVP